MGDYMYPLVQLLTSQLSADTLVQMERGHNIFAYIHYMIQVVDKHKHEQITSKGKCWLLTIGYAELLPCSCLCLMIMTTQCANYLQC